MFYEITTTDILGIGSVLFFLAGLTVAYVCSGVKTGKVRRNK